MVKWKMCCFRRPAVIQKETAKHVFIFAVKFASLFVKTFRVESGFVSRLVTILFGTETVDRCVCESESDVHQQTKLRRKKKNRHCAGERTNESPRKTVVRFVEHICTLLQIRMSFV